VEETTVWTPKRIVLLAVGFLVFTLLYIVYSMTFLGRINTLPPLPEQYSEKAKREPGEIVPKPINGPSPLERKLEQAFGIGCKELKWPVLLELRSKSMVMAAGRFEVENDGRVMLEPMSIALFGKKKNDGREVEINTLRCNQAYLTFDRPITSLSPSELSGRKIEKAELFGHIDIVNNRRTALRDDDLIVHIPTGPLYYLEKKQLIWTTDVVHLQDGPLDHPKADVNARGMKMELATAAPPPKPGAPLGHKPKNETISGVKRVVLNKDVDMHLFTSGGTPFPGSDKAPAPPSARAIGEDKPKLPPETSHIIVRTPGRFTYDILKDYDLAHFDVFHYSDILKDEPDDAQGANTPQDVVVQRVNERTQMNDQIVCKHLELQVKRRDSAPPAPGKAAPPPASSPEQGLEIEKAHAWGPDVTLTSDAEKLDAHGNDFQHDAAEKLTILKGSPFIEANKDGSLIQAPELRIKEIPLLGPPGSPPKTYQQILATGPGSIHMPNKGTEKRTTHAYWNDKLISTRDGDDDQLILTGSARFVDEEHEQSLKAETLKVWLLSDEKKPVATEKKPEPTVKKPDSAKPASTEGGRRPRRIEALRNVLARSPQLNIPEPGAGRLVIRFEDVPASRMPAPPPGAKTQLPNPDKPDAPARGGAPPLAGASGLSSVGSTPKPTENKTPPPGGGRQPPETRGTQGANAPRSGTDAPPSDLLSAPPPALPGPAASASTVTKPTTPAAPVGPALGAPAPADAPRPIDLSARSIEADVLRCGERTALDHLWSEGKVRVKQEPAKAGDKGVYIEGGTLDMKCYPDGNTLDVSGDSRDDSADLAQLLMDKIHILGPEIHIHQPLNKVWVYGAGAMRMDSNQSLDGKPLGRTVPLTIHWQRNMFFHGEAADFEGNIQAVQENAHLACQTLQVIFDRPISLKEGNRGDQPAKVRKLVADRDVRAEDSAYEHGQLQKFQKMEGKDLTLDTVPRDDEGPPPLSAPPKTAADKGASKNNDAHIVKLYGPGSVRLMQRGGADPLAAPSPTTPNAPPRPVPASEQEMKMTYVRFVKQMNANTETNTASFWESVQVLNFPCDDPNREIDLEAMLLDMPPGAMYMRCNQLKVHNHPPAQKGGPSYQEMEAHGQIAIQAREFWANSDHLFFNEAKDQIILLGDGDRPAVLAKIVAKGARPDVIRARKITYYRKTGKILTDYVQSLDGGG
jgi:hypothetical protein